MLNQTIIFGRLVRTPELKTTSGGKSVTTFSIAHDQGSGENKKTSFFDVTAWEKTAEMICKWFAQGSLIGIKGKLAQRTWTDQNGNKRSAVEIVADEVQFCEKKREAAETPQAPAPQEAPPVQSYGAGEQRPIQQARPYGADDGEDLPF